MTPEGIVKAAVLDYLKKSGRFYLRLNSGKVKVMGGWMQLCPAGTLDALTFTDSGRCMWIELKQLKGKLRKKQIEFINRAESMGHICVVARSVEDVVKAFKEAA